MREDLHCGCNLSKWEKVSLCVSINLLFFCFGFYSVGLILEHLEISCIPSNKKPHLLVTNTHYMVFANNINITHIIEDWGLFQNIMNVAIFAISAENTFPVSSSFDSVQCLKCEEKEWEMKKHHKSMISGRPLLKKGGGRISLYRILSASTMQMKTKLAQHSSILTNNISSIMFTIFLLFNMLFQLCAKSYVIRSHFNLWDLPKKCIVLQWTNLISICIAVPAFIYCIFAFVGLFVSSFIHGS